VTRSSTSQSRKDTSKRRASTFATLLGIVAVVELIIQVPAVAALARIPDVATILIAIGLALLVALVLDIDATNTVVAVIGVLLLAITIGLDGTLEAVVLVALMTWVVAGLRRWRR
jgi:hypothetical protein